MKTLTVSQTTQNFIDCHVELSHFFDQVSNSLAGLYNQEQAEPIIQGEFWEKYNEISEFLNKYLCISISEKIGCAAKELKEI
jgi:hypothetical protein